MEKELSKWKNKAKAIELDLVQNLEKKYLLAVLRDTESTLNVVRRFIKEADRVGVKLESYEVNSEDAIKYLSESIEVLNTALNKIT